MIEQFFTYILLGLALTLPVGPVTIQMMKQGLSGGFWFAWLVGLGGMTVDLILIFLLYFGFSTFILELPYLQTGMWFVGFLFLLFLGIQSIRESTIKITISEKTTLTRKSVTKAFGSGFIIALTPGYLMFWIGILGTLLASSLSDAQGSASFLFVASGIVTGILIHDLTFSWILSYGRRLLNQRAIQWLSIGAGVVLIGFGLYFGYEFLQEISS